MSHTAAPSKGEARPAALIFIFITVMIDMVAMGVTAPVLPALILQMTGSATNAISVNGWFVSIFALTQFVFSPVLGGLSDRFGRRPILLTSICGLGLGYLIMAVAPNLAWLFVTRVITGATSANISTASAYVADVTPPERRASAFGMIAGAFSMGFIIGPAIGGVLGGIDPRAPFWAAAAISLLNALYGWFVLPESLRRDRRSPFSWRRANTIGALRLLGSHAELTSLALMNLMTQFAGNVFPTVFAVYAQIRFGWSRPDIGICLGGFGACSAVVQWVLTGRTVRWLGERKTILLGLACGVVGMSFFGLARSTWVFAIGIPIMTMAGLSQPSVQAMMTRRVSAWEQGQLQGANAGLQSIAGVVAPQLYPPIYALFAGPLIAAGLFGAPFLLAAFFMLTSVVLAWWTFRKPEPAPLDEDVEITPTLAH